MDDAEQLHWHDAKIREKNMDDGIHQDLAVIARGNK